MITTAHTNVDDSLVMAEHFVALERDAGVKSTYFVLITSNFYNVFSAGNRKIIWKIISGGHLVGLHFDEAMYPECAGNMDDMVQLIKKKQKGEEYEPQSNYLGSRYCWKKRIL